MEEAIPAANWYYQTPPLPTQPFVHSGKAAPHLQRTTLVGNRHATHPIGATIAQSAGVAAAGTMPAALLGHSNLKLSDAQFC